MAEDAKSELHMGPLDNEPMHVCPDARVLEISTGHLLCRQAKGVPGNGVHDIVAASPLVPTQDVCGCVALCTPSASSVRPLDWLSCTR